MKTKRTKKLVALFLSSILASSCLLSVPHSAFADVSKDNSAANQNNTQVSKNNELQTNPLKRIRSLTTTKIDGGTLNYHPVPDSIPDTVIFYSDAEGKNIIEKPSEGWSYTSLKDAVSYSGSGTFSAVTTVTSSWYSIYSHDEDYNVTRNTDYKNQLKLIK